MPNRLEHTLETPATSESASVTTPSWMVLPPEFHPRVGPIHDPAREEADRLLALQLVEIVYARGPAAPLAAMLLDRMNGAR